MACINYMIATCFTKSTTGQLIMIISYVVCISECCEENINSCCNGKKNQLFMFVVYLPCMQNFSKNHLHG